ncbi:MAG TPA: RT0821/Lpp0805 family surface protein [Gammaproteobacteria bacterium]|jgi:surface antigen|nr:RT0821/Lpp0805 family surface protein [Gammaproteobacteria bacterium]
MKKIFTAITVFLCSIMLSGCQNMNNQDVGTIAGGVAGGLLGSTVGQGGGRMVAIAAGTLAGAYLGGAVGKNMDDNDRARMNQALESNSIGQPAYWQNERSGNSYQVTPTKNVTVDGNQYCREYRTTANIAGKRQQIYGTACRQPDGSWKTAS